MKVFVYGTLKEAYGNNRILRDGNARKVKDAIVDGYKLYNCGFPVARECNESAIFGEVWDIGDPIISADARVTLSRLDRLEGVPHMYTRETATTRCGEEVHFYVGNPRSWHPYDLRETNKDENNVYSWSR